MKAAAVPVVPQSTDAMMSAHAPEVGVRVTVRRYRPYADGMRARTAPPLRLAVTLLAISAAVLVGAALTPVPGVLPAAATGVLTCLVALTLSVRDAVVATVVGSALLVVAVGAGASTALGVAFMVAIAIGVAAATRVGRGTVALVVAAELAIVVNASADLSLSRSPLETGGVALASGLVVCAAAVYVVRWVPPSVEPTSRSQVVGYLFVLAPAVGLATLAGSTALGAARGWALPAFLVALAVGALPGRTLARLLAVVAGVFVAAAVVTSASGVPVLILILLVLAAGFCALTARTVLLAISLTAAVLLVSASEIEASAWIGPEPLLAAVGGAFVAWAALSAVEWLANRRASLVT